METLTVTNGSLVAMMWSYNVRESAHVLVLAISTKGNLYLIKFNQIEILPPSKAYDSLCTESCKIFRKLAPVCGDDGLTYANGCLARCNNVKEKCSLQTWTGFEPHSEPCKCEVSDFISGKEGKIIEILNYLSSVLSKMISITIPFSEN